ncbi:MAG: preprotein translocase subunit SecD [Natronomonas sp.]|jgi:preprotein translocase subunit SecD|uniref:preprotein translocase subunit SecD n=1 Tax=Natronomonas sp. TaxID=2184060 RepID=UPI003989F627
MKLSPRENWRIWLLVLFVIVSSVAVFAPTGGGSDANVTNESDAATQSTLTNLQFGLELSGGTQVRAPLVGMTAEGLEFQPDQSRDIERTVEDELGLGAGDVRADAQGGTVEVFADRHIGNVTKAEFVAALQEAGFSVTEEDVRMGVTAETREDTVEVLESKIDQSGLSGGTVTQVASPGQQFILVEVPGADREEVIELIGDRGQVETVALFPEQRDNETVYRNVSLLSQDDFAQVGSATQDSGRAYVPVTLTESSAEGFQQAMREFGFAQEGGTVCNYNLEQSLAENKANNPGRCLLTVLDGDVVFAARVTDGLADSFRDGSFADRPTYQSTTTSFEDARQLEINLKTGSLPTQLDIQNRGTTYFLLPSLADRFKTLSLATGAAAVLAVALVVFARYRRPEVAAPMLLTAAAEVYLLLGFAAAVGLPLDLSHIAGFIAVIGTGVDDLVIIADEIMQQGEVKTSRVFESRFRKAFWVIGAAAATTIIAMSPLAVLSLGDLQGFAIITIIGVLLGVLVTRPAYGDILRVLVLED